MARTWNIQSMPITTPTNFYHSSDSELSRSTISLRFSTKPEPGAIYSQNLTRGRKDFKFGAIADCCGS